METLQKLKETSSSNEKLKILEEELNEVNEFLIRKALNDEVFGLNTKTLMKVFNIKDLKGYEDVGDWIDKNNNQLTSSRNNSLVYRVEKLFKDILSKSGKNLIEYLNYEFHDYNKEELIWITRALLKDLKIGMSVTQVNKVFQKLNKPLIEVFQVQLCKALKVSELDTLTNYPYYCETKYDGTRTIAYIEKLKDTRTLRNLMSFDEEDINYNNISITLKSRQGKDTTSQFPEVVKALKEFAKKNNLTNTILDGEIISKDFNSIQKRLGRKENNIEIDTSLRFVIFDILKYENEDMKEKPFDIRREVINRLTHVPKIDYSNCYLANDKQSIIAFYNIQCARGEEGIIIKDRNGLYAQEKKDERKGMWKLKPVETMDLTIVGFQYGTGRHSNTVGSLKLTNKDNSIQCDCGSGLSDDERDRLLQLYKEDSLLNRIVEVKYWEIQKPDEKGIRSLRFPIYVCLREDKNESD